MKSSKKVLLTLGLLTAWPAWSQWTDSNMGFELGNTSGWTIGAGNTGTMTNTITQQGSGVSLITGSPGSVTFQSAARPGFGDPSSPYYQPAVTANTWQFSAHGNNMLALQPNTNTNWNSVGADLGLSAQQITGLSTLLGQQAQASGFGSGQITNLAYVYRPVTLTAGTTYSMAWNYIGTDYVPFNDGSITTLVPTGHSGNTTINNYNENYALLGFTNPGTGDYSAGTFGSTGWQSATYLVDTTGVYQLGFAVFNLDDTSLSPVLLIDEQQGTTLQNGNPFNPVPPNPGTSAPSAPGSEPSAPTVVSTSTTDVVTTSTANGTPTSASTVAFGTGVTVVTNTLVRGLQGATTLAVAQNTASVTTTPFTITTTTTTPVTTTTTTTPVTTTTYSDNTTTTSNGTPTVASATTDVVTVGTTQGEEVMQANSSQNYSTRVDQMSRMIDANRRINATLLNDPLDRHGVVDGAFRPKANLQGSEAQGWFYLIAENQEGNTVDGYGARTNRFGIGYEKNVRGDWLLGANYNNLNTTLSGDQAGGSMTKNHLGLYSLVNLKGWLLKTDLGFAANEFNNNHSIAALGLSNNGSTNGYDAWISNRLYTPSIQGLRPYVGVATVTSNYSAFTETGSAVTRVTHSEFGNSRNYADAGVRGEVTVKERVNLIAEAGRASDGLVTAKVGANFAPGTRVLGGVNLIYQGQNDFVNTVVQANFKVMF